MRRIRRVIRLIQFLHTRGPCSLDTLQAELGVGRRTVFRDLKVLQQAGLPCHFDRPGGGYVLERNSLIPAINLDLEEALVLLLLTRKAARSQMIPGHRSALSAALKIQAALPSKIVEHCGELLTGLEMRFWPMSDVGSASDVLTLLQRALVNRLQVSVRYDSYYERREIDTNLHIYRLPFIRRGWYAIAFSEHHREVRTFKIERMVAVKTLDRNYTIDADFDLDEYFGNAWQMIRGPRQHRVVIRFSPKVAGNVEEVWWHKTQETRHTKGGSLIFQVDVDGLSEIVWWILGYGGEATVLQPEELRSMVCDHARGMLSRYERGAAREETETA